MAKCKALTGSAVKGLRTKCLTSKTNRKGLRQRWSVLRNVFWCK